MLAANRRIACVLGPMAVLIGLMGPGCATSTQTPPDMDGLVLQPSPGLDAVYLRSDANFNAYGNIVLQPVQVTFDKDWDPKLSQRALSRSLSEQDLQMLKDEMASEFRSIFVNELASGGYQVVDQLGANSLVITAALADVYINDPVALMTLVMELHDGINGPLVGRIADHSIGGNFGRLEMTYSVTRSADFRGAVADWAERLRKELDTWRSNAVRLNGDRGR